MVADKVLIFDACAVIALLDGERGADIVEDLLLQEHYRCAIHIINVCEIYYHIYRSAGEDKAAQLETILREYGFVLDDSLSSEPWRSAGKLKATWRRISLADCFALALALQEDGTFVTSDHHELDRLAQAGICSFHFIR